MRVRLRWSIMSALTSALALSVLAACGSPSAGSAFKVPMVNGGTFSEKDLAGKVTIVDFWATWCAPCLMEIPKYNQLNAKYGDRGLSMLGVAVESGSADSLRGAIERLRIQYPVGLGNTSVIRAFGNPRALPTTFLVDRNGRIVKRWNGYTDSKHDEIDREVGKLLGSGA